MSADSAPLGVDEAMQLAATNRDQLAEKLKAAAKPAFTRPWRVTRQTGTTDVEVSEHQFELLADLRAYRLTVRHRTQFGVFYTVRRAAL